MPDMTEQTTTPLGSESQILEDQRFSSHAPSSASSHSIRRGKWTAEEEAYALAAIRDFNSGYLDAPPGTTLRAYLSENLQCDPMRITKKFTGDASIGKKVFRPVASDDAQTLNEIMESRIKLSALHQEWKLRLQSHEQEMTRKSMVDVAVSEASSLNVGANMHHESSSPEADIRCAGKPNTQIATTNNDMIKTATWLKRAEDILSQEIDTNKDQNEIEEEMMVISSLVSEAPEIVTISKRLPKLFHTSNTIGGASTTPKTTIPSSHISQGNDSERNAVKWNESGLKGDEVDDSPTYPMKLLASLSSQATPAPVIDTNCTATRTTPNNTTTAATEDAEDFVNFLQSVVHVKKS